jgi:hypothetical protein
VREAAVGRDLTTKDAKDTKRKVESDRIHTIYGIDPVNPVDPVKALLLAVGETRWK